MSTYEKLGQYSSSELPQAPTDLTVSYVDNEYIQLSWTNNTLPETYPEAVNVLQIWQDSYWLTYDDVFSITDSDKGVGGLSEGSSYRFRVAVLNDGVLYPTQPLVQATTSIPKPVLTESGVTTSEVGFNIGGYDASWEALKVYLIAESTGWQWELQATLEASATSYLATGLTESTTYYWRVDCTIAGSDYESEMLETQTSAAPLLPLTGITYPTELSLGGTGDIYYNNPNDYESLGGSYYMYYTDCQENLIEMYFPASDTYRSIITWLSECEYESSTFGNPITVYLVYTAGDGRQASGQVIANPTQI